MVNGKLICTALETGKEQAMEGDNTPAMEKKYPGSEKPFYLQYIYPLFTGFPHLT